MMNPLHRRILDISYRHKLSHLGSCLGAVDIIDEIYAERQPDEPFLLSCGHAGLALYVVLEKYLGKDAEDLFKRHGVHPTKNLNDGIYCSTGSLGQGISIAVGRALANRDRKVWCLISDGECAEGVVYESLNFALRHKLDNLKVYCHSNGYAAYRETYGINLPWMSLRGKSPEDLGYPFLKGQDAHYYAMKSEDWAWVEANT